MADDKTEFLNALGRRDLDLDLNPDEIANLRRAMRTLASTARLAHAAADRPAETALDAALGSELLSAAESPAFDVFERTGITEVLDENGQLVFQSMTVADVPTEDTGFLAGCGVKSPSDEITISVTRLKAGYWPVNGEGRSRLRTTEFLKYSRIQIVTAGRALSEQHVGPAEQPLAVPTEPKKRKKYFNGIGKILSGVVAGTGNVLIGTGAIPATGGAAVAGVIASAAVSVGIIMQGVGDLRGE